MLFKLSVPSVGVPVFVHDTPARSVNPFADTDPFKQSIHVMIELHNVLIELIVDVLRKLLNPGVTIALNVSVPKFEMLHRFMFSAPVIVVPDKLVTARLLVVSVPVV